MILITYVCMYVCMNVFIFIKLRITAQSGPVILIFYATRIDSPKGESMMFVTKTSDQARQRYACMDGCMYGCIYGCIFIKLHITAQSGPVIRVILCHSH